MRTGTSDMKSNLRRLEQLEHQAGRRMPSDPSSASRFGLLLHWRAACFAGKPFAIDPPPTEDELRRADEFLDEIRQAVEYTLFEKEGGERTFDEWLAGLGADTGE
jgi:hypothetical protein